MSTNVGNAQNNQPSTMSKVQVKPLPSGASLHRTNETDDVKPRITVVGIGGAGCNAVNNMIRSQLEGVEFAVMNTDAQALHQSLSDRRVHLGNILTQGLGAGSCPDVGKAAAEESHEEIAAIIKGSNMVFIAAGMGGGTGTGSAPIIAKIARDMGILTVGVVTKPFNFEGAHRMRTAERGIEDLQSNVDTLIIIPNQNLFRVANENTTFADAFKMADDVLYAGVRSITDLMIMPGLINLDFADVRTVMSEMGKAMMGTGEADGEGRAVAAAEAAIANPLIDDFSMRGANGVLISITGGMDMTLFEVDEAANRIREEVEDADANIIFGSTFDDRLNGSIRVSVVATGIQSGRPAIQPKPKPSSSSPEMAPKPKASTPKEEVPSPEPQQPSRPVLNLESEESDLVLQETPKQIFLKKDDYGDVFQDATEEGYSQGPASEERHIFNPDLTEDSPMEEGGAENKPTPESNQMEIDFNQPQKKAAPRRGQPDKKDSFSAGNFLSRFLRGKTKAQPAHKEAPVFASPPGKPSQNDNPNDDFEDDLDVPTFMRKQG